MALGTGTTKDGQQLKVLGSSEAGSSKGPYFRPEVSDHLSENADLIPAEQLRYGHAEDNVKQELLSRGATADSIRIAPSRPVCDGCRDNVFVNGTTTPATFKNDI